MKILTIAEHYPSPFKPYHDTQFERFVLDGHELTICAFGYHEGELNPVVQRHGFHRKTTYLPLTLKDLRSTAPRAFAALVKHPSACGKRIAAAVSAQASWKRNLLDAVRAALLPSEAPDLCIVHNLRALIHARVLRRLYPEAVIAFYYHGNELPGVPTADREQVVQALEPVDVIFTNTENSKGKAIERGCAPDKVYVCPVGFNLDDFPDPVDRAYLKGGRLNVLMAGRLAEGKGMLMGLRAFQEVTQEYGVVANLRIVGDGPEREQISRFIRENGLHASVTLLGRQTQQRLLEEYRAADVFVLPSMKAGNWEENQACVVQEAMLMRAVALVSRTGGVPESTAPEMLAYSFAPGDLAGLVDALLRVSQLGEAELRELGAKGRAFAEQRYDIRRLNAELIEIAMRCGPSRTH
nr:hypothetical protein [Gammaproteobacteria bacterium]